MYGLDQTIDLLNEIEYNVGNIMTPMKQDKVLEVFKLLETMDREQTFQVLQEITLMYGLDQTIDLLNDVGDNAGDGYHIIILDDKGNRIMP
jgi:hypothetical protein